MAKHILLVDDDPLMRRSLAFNLEQAGYRSSTAANAEDAIAMVRRESPDLVLLDIGLPGMDGLDALRKFKDIAGVPVIFVTARRRELDEVLGLELGADDYITKPFNTREVVARVKSLLRRVQLDSSPNALPHILTLGALQLDLDQHILTIDSVPIELTRTEFKLLEALLSNPGYTLTRQDLLDKAMGYAYEGMGRTLDTHIRNLRRKIEPDPDHPTYIQTVFGVGYRLVGGKE